MIFRYVYLIKLNQENYINILISLMGQQNEKVEFVPIDQEQPKKNREKIFKKSYTVSARDDEEVCNLPECKCSAKHQLITNQKICTVCDNSTRNFRRTKRLTYEKTSNPSEKGNLNSVFLKDYEKSRHVKELKDLDPVAQPSPIYYYNAWSLPIQKCFVQRSYKPLTDTNVTEIQHENSQHSEQEPYVPPYRPDTKPDKHHHEYYDYSKVNSRDRMQNLFLYDNK